MFRDDLSCWQNQANDFDIVALEQRVSFRLTQLITERTHIDDVAGLCVWNAHICISVSLLLLKE